MKKFIAAVTCAGLLFTSGLYATPAFAEYNSPAVTRMANVKTGILIIAPTEFKTQDFFKIATEAFGKSFSISQDTQDAWATYCYDKGLADTDPLITKEILADFAKTTNFDRIIFLILKDAVVLQEDLGVVYNISPFFGGIWGSAGRKIRIRSNIETRVVVMNHAGEALKVFEESYTDASMASKLRANRGAFKGICKRISKRLSDNK